MRQQQLLRIVVIALLCWSAVAIAGERGFFGYGISVTGKGFPLNPTIKRVTIASLVPGSPAARAGVGVGDEIVKAEGMAVVGKKGKELQALARRDIGQTLRLELKRPSGEVYAVALVAVRRPPGL